MICLFCFVTEKGKPNPIGICCTMTIYYCCLMLGTLLTGILWGAGETQYRAWFIIFAFFLCLCFCLMVCLMGICCSAAHKEDIKYKWEDMQHERMRKRNYQKEKKQREKDAEKQVKKNSPAHVTIDLTKPSSSRRKRIAKRRGSRQKS